MENPKIRFKGFTKDWEQRKFSEFVENVAVRNREGLELECYAVTNDRGFISQKEAHDDFGYMADVDKTAYNIVPPNSFAYNPARINVGSIGYYAGTENVIVSSLYEVFRLQIMSRMDSFGIGSSLLIFPNGLRGYKKGACVFTSIMTSLFNVK